MFVKTYRICVHKKDWISFCWKRRWKYVVRMLNNNQRLFVVLGLHSFISWTGFMINTDYFYLGKSLPLYCDWLILFYFKKIFLFQGYSWKNQLLEHNLSRSQGWTQKFMIQMDSERSGKIWSFFKQIECSMIQSSC